MSVKDMIKDEIEKLPDSLLSEVLDFIKSIEAKKERTLLAKASQKLSMPSFEKIWNNDEDSVYDSL